MTELLRFDRNGLRSRAFGLSPTGRTAFATACATRLANCAVAHSNRGDDVNADKHIVDLIWNYLLGGEVVQVAALDADILDRLSDEAEEFSFGDIVANDALSATAYALRTIDDEDLSNLCCAAQVSYDLVDRYAGQFANAPEFTEAVEQMIASHVVVQTELRRQRRDLELLINSENEAILRKLRDMVAEESTLP